MNTCDDTSINIQCKIINIYYTQSCKITNYWNLSHLFRNPVINRVLYKDNYTWSAYFTICKDSNFFEHNYCDRKYNTCNMFYKTFKIALCEIQFFTPDFDKYTVCRSDIDDWLD